MSNKTVTLVIEGGALEYVTPLPGDRVTEEVEASEGDAWDGRTIRIEREVPAPPTSATPRDVLAEQLYLKRLEVAGLPATPFATKPPEYQREWLEMADYAYYLSGPPELDQWKDWLDSLPTGTVVQDADEDLARKTPDGAWEDTLGQYSSSAEVADWSIPLSLVEDQGFPW